jgi:hypothetical protein
MVLLYKEGSYNIPLIYRVYKKVGNPIHTPMWCQPDIKVQVPFSNSVIATSSMLIICHVVHALVAG